MSAAAPARRPFLSLVAAVALVAASPVVGPTAGQETPSADALPHVGPTSEQEAGAGPGAPGSDTPPSALVSGQAGPLVVSGTTAGSMRLEGPRQVASPPWPSGPAPRAGRFLSWSVSVEARGSSALDLSPLDFRAEMTDGRVFDHLSGSLLFVGKDALQTVTVRRGQSVAGTLTLDVPEGRGRLVYAPSRTAPLSWSF